MRYLQTGGVIGYPVLLVVADIDFTILYEQRTYKTLNGAVKYIKSNLLMYPDRFFAILPIAHVTNEKIYKQFGLA